MCPLSVSTSRSVRALERGEAKLWVLLIGVNQYADARLPHLSYSALDCQGLGEAIAAATQTFPQKSVVMHHDFAAGGEGVGGLPSVEAAIAATGRLPLGTLAKWRSGAAQAPTLAAVRASLEHLIAEAKPQDTVLFYFSGHGVLSEETAQAVLCLSDTQRHDLLQTGLGVQELLDRLGQCKAHQQLVWLDACHSGGMTLRVAKGEAASEPLPNPTPQLVELLRQRAAQSKGFYALLSCDQNQQSWEFPELGHGVFTYFLMRGLLGEAADAQGVIEVDALYKYVYYQTLHYIDKTNQQLRLINQQKRGRGETQLQQEYPLQTPKRIVEGVGELILGVRPVQAAVSHPRRSLVIDGWGSTPMSLSLSRLLQKQGGFDLTFFPQGGKSWSGVRQAIQSCLLSEPAASRPEDAVATGGAPTGPGLTGLLYLRGKVDQSETGEALLLLKDDVQISRSWLRQVLRRSPLTHQIVILDCPGATNLGEWIDDLQTDPSRGQCLMAVASPVDDPERFTQILVRSLETSDPQAGLSAAGWIAQLQSELADTGMVLHVWLSGTQGVIEILPGQSTPQTARPADNFDLGLCPYLGLQAFSEEDAPFFFGRESLTRQLVNALRQASFLAVVGASGSGKSSVVQAGLVAQLRQGRALPGSDRWWIRSLRPGDRPLDALAKRLVDPGTAKEQMLQQMQIEGLLHLGAEGFVQWLRSRPEPMILLVVDQFEELFTLATPTDRQQFLDLVLAGVEFAGDRFKLVLTLRTDFMAPCLELPQLAERLQQASILVPPHLSAADYRQIITQPAEKVGLRVDPELVEVLLQELNHGAGDLPLLEFVLEQVWQHRTPGELTLSVYQQQIGGLKGALERKAQAVYDSLDPAAQACARWIFLSLTQLGDGTEDTRRRILKSDLVVKKFPAALVERTLQALVAAKLVVINTETPPPASQDTPAPTPHHAKGDSPPTPPTSSIPPTPSTPPPATIEVAHEILIRHWSTLRWWLEENRTRLSLLRQIEAAALQWKQSGRQQDFLLQGVRLDAAEEIYVKYTDELSQDVQAFIEAGLAQRDRQQKEAQHRLQRARRAIALISTLGLCTAVLGGVAFLQQQQAQQNEIAALNALSEAQWLADDQLEAQLTALRAGHLLRSTLLLGSNSHALRLQTLGTLQQAVQQTAEVNRFEGHSQRINQVTVSQDGQQIASASDDGSVRLWRPDGTLLKTLATGGDRITGIAFSPDGQRLVSAGRDGVQVWDISQGKAIATLSSDASLRVAWSPTGGLVATAGADGTVHIFDANTNQPLRTVRGSAARVNAVRFSANGRWLATAGDDSLIRVWQAADGKLLRTFPGHSDRINDVTFTPDDQFLVSASDDRTLRLWNLATGTAQTFTPLAEGRESHGDRVLSVSISPKGKRVASSSADGTIHLWSLEGALLETIGNQGAAVLTTAFQDDQTLVSAGVDKVVHLWQFPGQFPASVPMVSAFTAVFHPGDRTFAAAGWDGSIYLGDGATGRTIAAHTQPIHALAYNSTGLVLASGSDDQTIQLWTGDTRRQTITGHQGTITSLSFSPDGKWLASGSTDQTVRLWNGANGAAIATLKGHQDSITSVAFSPDGKLLASGSDDATAKLWKLDGTLVRSLAAHTAAIATIAFHPNGKLLATGSWDNTIKLWQIEDGTLSQTLSGHQNGVTSLRFSPDGKTLFSASSDRTLKLWDVETGRLIKTLRGATDAIRSIDVDATGMNLLTASETEGTRIWSLALEDLLKDGCDRIRPFLQTHQNIQQSDRFCVE